MESHVCQWYRRAAAYNADVVNMQHRNAAAHGDRPHSRHTTEVSGLLLLAFLLLVGTVIRYWHAIHWSVR
ncbi:MAG: hypothetical protein WB919_06535 [Candidatus Sulfotelmatobacter sp.]